MLDKVQSNLDPAALEPYLENGWAILPLHRPEAASTDKNGRERKDGKRPLHSNWTNRKYDAAKVIEIYGGKHNIGIQLRSEELVIDIDPRNGGDAGFQKLCDDFQLDPTTWPCVITGSNGEHRYLRKDASVAVVDTLESYPGVEFKSHGRQVVAAGSVHPDTRRVYEWDNFSPDLSQAKEVPANLLAAIARPPAPVHQSQGGEHTPDEVAQMLSALDPLNFNTNALWFPLMAASHFASAAGARQEWIEWSIGDPKFADCADQIGRRWDSLTANPQGRAYTTWTLYKALHDIDAGHMIPAPDPAEDFESSSDEEDESTKWPRALQYQGAHGAINANKFIRARPKPLIASNDELFSFDGEVWKALAEQALRAEIRRTDPLFNLDSFHVTKMVQSIRDHRYKDAHPFDWIKPPKNAPKPRNLVLFRNGILDFATGDLLPHNGAYFATGVPNFDYDPFADCPRWLRFLDEVLDESFHHTLQEYLGYLLTPDNSAQKFLMLLGVSRGGKSVVAGVAEALVGTAHSTSAVLSDLGTDFGLQSALDKRVMILPDAHDTSGRTRGAALERLKAITGGDTVAVNRKGISQISVRLPTRLLIVANKNPKFIDESGALANRALILTFERSFLGKEDRELASQLASELPGIAVWALAGLRRLRSNNMRFTESAAGRRAVQDMARDQSPARRFAEAHLLASGEKSDFETESDVFSRYREWALYEESLGAREIQNQNEFANSLVAALAGKAKRGRPRVAGKPRPRVFVGVRLKPEIRRT